ncbi:MAG: cyclopropane-fatty-acyl-phospholipid synthase, partial [Vicinamibacterales bacterium]
YGEEFTRAWELYLVGSEAAFAAGSLQLFQVVFAPMEAAPPYWTRAAVYRNDDAPASYELIGSEER